MWHSYAGGFMGKRQDMLDHLEHEDKRLETFLMGTLHPYFNKTEIKKMNQGKDFWIDTKEACQRGICTHVAINGTLVTADAYINPKKQTKEKKVKKVKKEKIKNKKI